MKPVVIILQEPKNFYYIHIYNFISIKSIFSRKYFNNWPGQGTDWLEYQKGKLFHASLKVAHFHVRQTALQTNVSGGTSRRARSAGIAGRRYAEHRKNLVRVFPAASWAFYKTVIIVKAAANFEPFAAFLAFVFINRHYYSPCSTGLLYYSVTEPAN